MLLLTRTRYEMNLIIIDVLLVLRVIRLTFYYHPASLFFMCDGRVIFLLLIGFFDFDLFKVSAPEIGTFGSALTSRE